MERKKLTDEAVEAKLQDLQGWRAEDGKLQKKYSFADFAESLGFVNKAGALADAADHHPDITLGWGYAKFEITTHDRGGITDFDFDLARKIDAID